VADTGPLLHLEEIGWLTAVTIFDHIFVSFLIARELREYGVDTSALRSRKQLSIWMLPNKFVAGQALKKS